MKQQRREKDMTRVKINNALGFKLDGVFSVLQEITPDIASVYVATWMNFQALEERQIRVIERIHSQSQKHCSHS